MRSFVRLGAVCAALVILAGCREKTRLLKVDSAPLASPNKVDFGLISLHGQAERKIVLANAGRAPLRVNAVGVEIVGQSPQALSSDPGATLPFAASPQREVPMTLTTGERTEITLRYTPKAVGPIRGVLSVENDSSSDPKLFVELAGEAVDAQAKIGPGQLDFGKIEVGSSAVQGLTIANDSPLDVVVTPTPVGADSDEFSANQLKVPAHSQRQMAVTFLPTRLGHVASELSVTRCEGCQADTILLYGEGIDSAMVVDPNPLNFGSVPVDATGRVDCRLINVSSVPLELYGVQLDPGSDQGYKLEQQVPDYILPPGAWLATTVSFTPTHLGPANGALVVASASKRHPQLSVPLIGSGGGAEIAIAPDRVDFGDVPLGGQALAKVTVRNAGTNGNTLTVYSASLSGPSSFQIDPAQLPATLAAGQAMDLQISFTPMAAGPATATLNIASSDGSTPNAAVPITASARTVAPCRFSLSPRTIDFGNVPPGTGAVLGLRFRNDGSDVCAVRNVDIVDDSQGAFFMPGGAIRTKLIYPGDSFETQVAFQPKQLGDAQARVFMHVTDPSQPTVELPLKGHSEVSCLTAAPNYIDFGPLRRDCQHPTRKTHIVNACSAPVEVDSVWIGDGTSSEFSIVSGPTAAVGLQPGAGFNVEVAYAADETGQNFSPLYATESDVQTPFLVPLLGEGLPDGNMKDHFVQTDGKKADVLLIVDNSNSMAEEQPKLAAAIPALVQAAAQKGMDLHVAVTTTGIDPVSDPGCNGGASGGEAGRLFPANGSAARVVDLAQGTANASQAIEQNVNVGLCHHLEQGLEAMRRALSSPLVDHADDPRTPLANDGNLGFVRDDAQLSVVVVSDEDDHSGDDVNDYATFLRSVHGLSQPQRVGFFSIAPLSSCATSSGSSAPRYQAMAQATGGMSWDVCASSYDAALAQIADLSFGTQGRFPLTQPADATTLQVSIDGQPAPAGSWSYDASTNAVVLSPAPAAGAQIDVAYKELCP